MREFDFPNQVFTDMQQSRRLLVSGFNPESADLSFINGGLTPTPYSKVRSLLPHGENGDTLLDFSSTEVLPAWSLTSLMKLFPRGNKTIFYLCMESGLNENIYVIWDTLNVTPSFESESPVEAVVKALSWIHFNKNKIK